MRAGLRERKKQEARQRISSVATRLFLEHGFDKVTVTEIADVAGCSKMTVFNYFPRKEDMFLDRHSEAVDLLVTTIREREPGQPVGEAVRVLMHRLLAERHPLSGTGEGPEVALFGRVVVESPALVSRVREQVQELESAVAAALAEESKSALEADLAGRLLLAAVRTVVVTAMGRLIDGDDPAVVAADQVGVIDRTFEVIAKGLGGF